MTEGLYTTIKTKDGEVRISQDDKELQKVVDLIYDMSLAIDRLEHRLNIEDDKKPCELSDDASDIIKHIDWAMGSIRSRFNFGLDPLSAAHARERRAKGALLACREEIILLRELNRKYMTDENGLEREINDGN